MENHVTAASAALRDQFAGQIYAAMLQAPTQPGVSRLEGQAMARAAYDGADDLLKARAEVRAPV